MGRETQNCRPRICREMGRERQKIERAVETQGGHHDSIWPDEEEPSDAMFLILLVSGYALVLLQCKTKLEDRTPANFSCCASRVVLADELIDVWLRGCVEGGR